MKYKCSYAVKHTNVGTHTIRLGKLNRMQANKTRQSNAMQENLW